MSTIPPPDYLKQAQDQLDGRRYESPVDWSAHAFALAAMGILQQLTRIADMMATEVDRDRWSTEATADETETAGHFCGGCTGAGTGARCCICGGARLRAKSGD